MNSQDRQALDGWSLQPVTLLSDTERMRYTEAAQDFYSNILQSSLADKDIQNLSRVPASVDPAPYQKLIKDHLGWSLFAAPKKINNDKIAYLGDTRSIILGRMPIFLLKTTHHPERKQDKLVNDLTKLIQRLKVKHGFIFFKKPIIQKANKHFYTYTGQILIEGTWHNYFLRKGDAPDQLVKLTQHNKQWQQTPSRSDSELETAFAFTKLSTDVQIPPGIEERILAANQSWYSFEKGSGLYL